jgi:hypothetical protein
LVHKYVTYNQNIPKVYSNQYSVKKIVKTIDASEKWYQKAEVHDLFDEKSLSPHAICSTLHAIWYKSCVDVFIFSSIYKIVWMPIFKWSNH